MHPTSVAAFRLPLDVRPLSYHATLSVDVEGRGFSGQLRLSLRLGSAVGELVLHATGLTLTSAVAEARGTEQSASVTPVAVSETVRLGFARPLPAGPVTLRLAWTGRFCDGLRGLYLAGPGLAATQFEAADARRVFPCLDEPGFKAPWRLEVEAPAGAVVLSNGAAEGVETVGERRRHRFAETPPLPTYLVALVVGPLVSSPADQVRGVTARTWASPEKAALLGFGQEVARAALPRLEDYFGLPYAFGKLDQVGLPEFEAGAMENAGLITYREVALLLDPATASLAQRKRVAEVVTHELAHQWFGNLVTMTWWDDLWLNEAFATWIAYLVVDDWKPEWRVWLGFDQGKASALGLDALRSTHPVHAPVRTVAEATESFDLITYEKGGAVLRMLDGYLGRETFRDGIRRYMRRHARGNAVAADLWRALGEASGEPVPELAEAWIDSPGFPLVAVTADGARLRVSQRRFFSRPGDEEPGRRWPVPVVLRYAAGGELRERKLVLRQASEFVTLEGPPDWLVANAGATGFYRVDLDAPLRERLARNLGALAPSERVGLLADEWALVRSGDRSIEEWLTLSLAFEGETDHAVLDELVARLSTIDRRLVTTADRPRFAALVRQRFGAAWGAAGWEAAAGEGDVDRLRRAALLEAVGVVGRDAAVTGEAAARLERHAAGDHSALDPNLVDAAVTLAARGGGAARWEQFRARFERELEPAWRRRWLLGLGAFEAPEQVERSLALLFGGGVPLQDWASFVAALMANPAALGPAWARLRAEWPAVTARLANAPMLLRRVVEATGQLTTRAELEEARGFFASRPVEPVKAAVAQTLERLAEEVELAERAGPALGKWLGG